MGYISAYKAGKPILEIAKFFGVPEKNVYRALSRHGVLMKETDNRGQNFYTSLLKRIESLESRMNVSEERINSIVGQIVGGTPNG
jgi:hypothetical protein